MRHLIFTFHAITALLLVVALVNCQIEDDALFEDERIDSRFLDKNGLSSASDSTFDFELEPTKQFIPTFVSPVERFMRSLLKPLTWVTSIGNQDGNQNKPTNQIISESTKPIKTTGKAIRGTFGQVLNRISSKFKAIYPGTEWCGAGNRSSSVDNVGLFKKTDACCREHDLCNINMEAGQSSHGLLNSGTFTRSHCDCDSEFYTCLKKVRSLPSVSIGRTYFNFLRPQCFKEHYPAECTKYGKNRITFNKCIEYKYDETESKKWQWFDNPDF